ncbi:MAG: hypothetical protein IT316_05240, partial [Anaerolineales bacterium]|nr:hypothetical protein [Anaerolineales bacterium]
NVSKFGPRLAGVGGFVNISQNAKKVVFLGSFTTGGLEVELTGDGIKILKEGAHKRFLNQIDQISFSGEFAMENQRKVLIITERAVFRLGSDGLILEEIAPGIDLRRDILDLMEFSPIMPQPPRLMDRRIFSEQAMGFSLQSDL